MKCRIIVGFERGSIRMKCRTIVSQVILFALIMMISIVAPVLHLPVFDISRIGRNATEAYGDPGFETKIHHTSGNGASAS